MRLLRVCHLHVIYKLIHCCSHYIGQTHYSMYAVTQGIGLEVFIRINDRGKMRFYALCQYISRKTEVKLKHVEAFGVGPYGITQ